GNNRIGLIASVSGVDDNTNMSRMAIVGVTDGDIGVLGRSTSTSGSASGVYGETINGTGLEGVATGALGWGIYARGGQYGALLQGNVAPLRLSPFTVPGAPTSGAHSRGEFIVDSRGDLYFCTANGSPGAWVRLTPATTALPLVSK
ncbi:MAG TPA: hypothetical protein VGE07_15490, partial [Herpetosiphonaceae bacterium]